MRCKGGQRKKDRRGEKERKRLSTSYRYLSTVSHSSSFLLIFSFKLPAPVSLSTTYSIFFFSGFPLSASLTGSLSVASLPAFSVFSSQFKASATAGASRRFSVCGKKRQGGSQETFPVTVVEYHSLNSKYGLL